MVEHWIFSFYMTLYKSINNDTGKRFEQLKKTKKFSLRFDSYNIVWNVEVLWFTLCSANVCVKNKNGNLWQS